MELLFDGEHAQNALPYRLNLSRDELAGLLAEAAGILARRTSPAMDKLRAAFEALAGTELSASENWATELAVAEAFVASHRPRRPDELTCAHHDLAPVC